MGCDMKPDSYRLLEQCVETGVSLGLRRAYKHCDDPSEDAIADHIQRAIMGEVCEWFVFDDLRGTND